MAGRWSGPNDSDCERPLVTDLWLLGWPTPRVITAPKNTFVRTVGAVAPTVSGQFPQGSPQNLFTQLSTGREGFLTA